MQEVKNQLKSESTRAALKICREVQAGRYVSSARRRVISRFMAMIPVMAGTIKVNKNNKTLSARSLNSSFLPVRQCMDRRGIETIMTAERILWTM
jgi:hypothetical protein